MPHAADVDLDEVLHDATRAVAAAGSPEELRALKSELLGKRGVLAGTRRMLGQLEPEERQALGRRLEQTARALEKVLAQREAQLHATARQARLEADRIDLTEVACLVSEVPGLAATGDWGIPRPRGTVHLVERTRQELEDVFVGMGFVVCEGPEVETDWYNFEALNIPPAHPARGMWDTLYLDLGEPETVLLRTHTSPVQVRLLQARQLPVYAVMPGRCYRRDTPDARHIPTFHQIEGLVVDHGVSFADLAGTIETFTSAYFGPDIHSRLRPAYFPFTEPSAEFEITCTICRGSGCRTCSQTGWIELGGCGMVDPAVLDMAGVDSEEWTGFAFGFGIDRCAQMRHAIPDMRVLLDNDVRFLSEV